MRDPKNAPAKNYAYEDGSVFTQATCLNRIFRKVSAVGLSEEALQELDGDFAYVSHLYGIDRISIVLLAAVLEKTVSNNPMDDEDLANYLGCSNIEFIRYYDNIRSMDKAGFIITGGGRGGRHCYKASPEILKAVESNGAFKPVLMTGLNTEEIFSRFRKYFGQYKQGSLEPEDLLEELDTLIRYNDSLFFCSKVLDSALYGGCSDTERRFFFYMCHQFVSHGSKSVEIDTITHFTEFMEDDERIKRHIANESTPLQRGGLVCFAMEDGFVDTTSLSLSDKVKSEFLCEVELAPEESVRHRDLISADSIQAKELFFNESEGAQIARLEGLLNVENFKAVQDRLQSCGMRKGFNSIFYGAPGTGKTASVYELARRTGRDIFRVDMSKLKSKWVGESEKSVRGVFRMYRSFCTSGKTAPILLFNEADAIFSRRIENVERSVDQMNNAIQNIILEEMENLEGILIATTNLLSNLDSAFERRFIFKVEFKMPEKGSRARIWKSMVPVLSAEDADTLADRYAFSGGNIENIARKSTVEYVLSGNEPTLSALDTYCQEEILNRKKSCSKIGF